MPSEVKLGMPPAGYALTAARADEEVSVQYLEFTSSEDGQHFIKRLEGLPNDILNRARPAVSASQIDTMLAICRKDGTATVYINEVALKARVRTARNITVGSWVKKSDIVDIDCLEFDVEIPKESGVLFVFSAGWRKGLFYDFGPIAGPNPMPREYDIGATLGQAYCHLVFQERFGISDDEWTSLFAAKWFPFVGLGSEAIDILVDHIRCGWNPDEKLEQFVKETKDKLTEMVDTWRSHESFHPHISLFERAAERFVQGDYMSCTALLFPRIEGLLRTHHTSLGAASSPSPNNLTESAVRSKGDREKCLLLPHRFAAYLRDVYFANFNPVAQNIDVSRHSIAHGVASVTEFNEKSALLAILVIHQLFYFLEKPPQVAVAM